MHENQSQEILDQLTDMGIDVTSKGAGHHVKVYLETRTISYNAAARVMGVSPSTINRFVTGGSLTEEMAFNLNKHYGFSVNLLFTLEAAYHIHNVEQRLLTA